MNLLNLGCGSTYHPTWTNIDLFNNEHVMKHNVYGPLPFDDGKFDVVYHAHLLEHLHKLFAPLFMEECYRVLKPRGIIRVVVPDLEEAARSYLEAVKCAEGGWSVWQERYDWTVIELIDQLCRHVSGGEMLEYWKQDPMPAEEFVLSRVGQEAYQTIKSLRKHARGEQGVSKRPLAIELDPKLVGKFRTAGQVHLWMYDRYSLGRLLEEAGFQHVCQTMAHLSDIPNFTSYNLDTMEDGTERKPDSIYFEGMK